jgi:hypothetical protein
MQDIGKDSREVAMTRYFVLTLPISPDILSQKLLYWPRLWNMNVQKEKIFFFFTWV